MAFKRTSMKSLVRNNTQRFSTAYKFSKQANFDVGKDAYIIPLGLESGLYETPCHRVMTHKIDGKIVGFGNSTFPVYVKCNGVDEEGNKLDSLCCKLAQMEKDRIPDKADSAKRIISFTNYRIHLPVLILGNSLGDKNKGIYPVSKVSILNDLRSETGLKFAFIEMSSGTFKNDILLAYGKKLKEDGVLEYDLDENSEEFLEEVYTRLSSTVIKVHGVSKQGFNAALKEYSFFPFDNPAIANGSPAGEREAIVGYRDNQEIQNKICEFLDLFNVEVDNMFNDWTEKDLQEYYNSAIGLDIKNNINEPNESAQEPEETVEVIEDEEEEKPIRKVKAPASKPETSSYVDEDGNTAEPVSDDEMASLLEDPFANSGNEAISDSELDEFEFDMEDEDDFFSED